MCWRHLDAQEHIISQPCQQVFILALCTRCPRRTLQKPARRGKMMEFQLNRCLCWANDALTVYNHAQSLISEAEDGGPNQTGSGLSLWFQLKAACSDYMTIFSSRVGLVMVPNPNTQTETTWLCQVLLKCLPNTCAWCVGDVLLHEFITNSPVPLCFVVPHYGAKRRTWK